MRDRVATPVHGVDVEVVALVTVKVILVVRAIMGHTELLVQMVILVEQEAQEVLESIGE
jgi:hypothetical protein